MAFTGTNVKTDAWSYLGDAPIDSDVITAINEFIAKLAADSLCYAEADQTAQLNTWYPLPTGCLAITEVATSTGSTYRYWRERGGKVAFADAGTFKIVHQLLPTPIAAIGDTVPLHDAFRPACTHYVEGWLKLQDDDENADGQRLLTMAEVEAKKVADTLRAGRRSKPGRVQVVR